MLTMMIKWMQHLKFRTKLNITYEYTLEQRKANMSTSLSFDFEETQENKNPLWEFSLLVYAHKEVEEACLYFQNHHDFNVNVILLASWLAKTGRGHLQESDIVDIQHLLADWHECITSQLRELRQILKKRKSVKLKQIEDELKKHELYAEYVEQNMLFENYSRPINQKALLEKIKDLWNSLYYYRCARHKEFNLVDIDMLKQLFLGVFPYAEERMIETVLSTSTE